ncbi:MAG: hypothetical protein QG635_330 [Bacteroidota bacterium]|nr:hypothetical protein [Bacteroidota bacterium]
MIIKNVEILLYYKNYYKLLLFNIVFMNNKDDNTVIKEILKGNKAEFGYLVVKYQKPVYNYAVRMVKDIEDAKDLTQNVFIKVYDKLSTFNSNYKFFSWIYRIAVNETINFLNARKVHEDIADFGLSAKLKDKTADSQELSAMLIEAMQFIQVQERTLITLKYYQGFAYSEIAEIMSIPETKVKSGLYSARQSLKNVLINKGYFDV